MVVSNHPLASSAGAEMLAAGGNAIDAAIATLFTLTVVEPMMVGIIGGGMAHIRLADGSHRYIDGQSTVPSAVRPDTYRSKPGSAHDVFDTVDHENLNGPKAVATPGSLKAWCETLRRFGTMSLADVMQPAIRHAARGYAATPYLHECITDSGAEMLKKKGGAGFAVGVAIRDVIEAVALDSRAVLPVSSVQNGCYGIKDVATSVPTVIGREGVVSQYEIELWPKELQALKQSASVLRETIDAVFKRLNGK